jgi:hypothetical protein
MHKKTWKCLIITLEIGGIGLASACNSSSVPFPTQAALAQNASSNSAAPTALPSPVPSASPYDGLWGSDLIKETAQDASPHYYLEVSILNGQISGYVVDANLLFPSDPLETSRNPSRQRIELSSTPVFVSQTDSHALTLGNVAINGATLPNQVTVYSVGDALHENTGDFAGYSGKHNGADLVAISMITGIETPDYFRYVAKRVRADGDPSFQPTEQTDDHEAVDSGTFGGLNSYIQWLSYNNSSPCSKIETITVKAGTFKTCLQVDGDLQVWSGNVPVDGIVKIVKTGNTKVPAIGRVSIDIDDAPQEWELNSVVYTGLALTASNP